MLWEFGFPENFSICILIISFRGALFRASKTLDPCNFRFEAFTVVPNKPETKLKQQAI